MDIMDMLRKVYGVDILRFFAPFAERGLDIWSAGSGRISVMPLIHPKRILRTCGEWYGCPTKHDGTVCASDSKWDITALPWTEMRIVSVDDVPLDHSTRFRYDIDAPRKWNSDTHRMDYFSDPIGQYVQTVTVQWSASGALSVIGITEMAEMHCWAD